jgi:hypothetical protein
VHFVFVSNPIIYFQWISGLVFKNELQKWTSRPSFSFSYSQPAIQPQQVSKNLTSQFDESPFRIEQKSVKNLPLLGTFYYPWYGNSRHGWRHWREKNHYPPKTWASNFLPDLLPNEFDPTRKLYDSNDEDIIRWQLASMKRAGIQFAISSWWGPNDYSDVVFKNALLNITKQSTNPHPSLKWSLYYEKQGYSNIQQSEIVSDLEYILENYSTDQQFLKIDGKPVVFIYYTMDTDTSSYLERWAAARKQVRDVYIVLKIIQGYRDKMNIADSWHQYAPANRFSVQAPYSAFVSPRFWKYDEMPKLERNLDEFKDAVRQMKAQTNLDFWLVETWNEYHEGTMIEPAKQIVHEDNSNFFKSENSSYGLDFIDALKS